MPKRRNDSAQPSKPAALEDGDCQKADRRRRVDPIYKTSAVNAPISLYEGAFRIEQEGLDVKGNGSVSWKWLPSSGLYFEIDVAECPLDIQKPATLHLVELDRSADVMLTHLQMQFAHGFDTGPIRGVFSSSLHGAQDVVLREIVFHLPNSRDFARRSVRQPVGCGPWVALVHIDMDDWTITIDKLDKGGRPDWDELVADRGSAITHVGRIERASGGLFSAGDAASILQSLTFFLSFRRGLKCAPILPVGFNEKGEKVWWEWSNANIAPEISLLGSVDLSANGIEKAFPGFWRLFQDEFWREPIAMAIQWYVQCTVPERGVEGLLVHLQTALELLSWAHIVEDRGDLSEQGFNKLPASDRIRVLLSACGIPRKIPSALGDLVSHAKACNWVDGPHAVTEMRNAVVHPKRTNRERTLETPHGASEEAWSLALWYLELTLLRLFDYNGSYSNRVSGAEWRGAEVEVVPWAARTS